jgi:hypothetical protein
VYEDLQARVHAAAARAADLVRQAEMLVDVAAATRGETFAVRCAWCGRYRLGEQWVAPDDYPAFRRRESELTHTICSRCHDELHAAGLSA